MRLRQKICLSSLLMFMAVFVGADIMTIENNRRVAFNRILQQATGEQESISSGIEQYVWARGESAGGEENYINHIAEYLESRVNPQGTALEIRADDRVVYSATDFSRPPSLEVDYIGRLPEYKVQEIEGKEYLILSSHFPMRDSLIRNLFFVDISGIQADRMRQYAFFIRLAAGTAVLLAAGMYLLTGHLTKMLRLLTDSAKEIGEGNYGERITVKTKDEVGELAESYNKMAGAIEAKVEELQRKTEEQQRFTDNFTHELRTPLTAVVGYADLIRSTRGDEEYVQELGDCIFQEGKRIEKLSESMMDMVFIRRHHFEMEPCEAAGILQQAAKEYEPIAAKSGLRLLLDLSEDSCLIYAKKELIVTLLVNLLDNAGKASKEGQNIWLRQRKEGEAVIAEVMDEGRGIPREEQDKIFESFYMVDKVRNRKNNGVGLGLSICRDIAEIHRAKIEIVSEVQKGTLVKVSFPCYKEVTKPL